MAYPMSQKNNHSEDCQWLTHDTYAVMVQKQGVSSMSFHWENSWFYVGPIGAKQKPQVAFMDATTYHADLPDCDYHRRRSPRNDPYNREAPPSIDEGSLELGWAFVTVSRLGTSGMKFLIDIPKYGSYLEVCLFSRRLLGICHWIPGKHHQIPLLVLDEPEAQPNR